MGVREAGASEVAEGAKIVVGSGASPLIFWSLQAMSLTDSMELLFCVVVSPSGAE